MTRAQCIARALQLRYGREVVKEIRRHFNTPKSERGFKWVYATPPLMWAIELPTMREKSFAQLAREAEQ